MHEESFSIECNQSFPNTDFQDQRISLANRDYTPIPCKVLGRKINSIAMLMGNQESACKYPLPVQVSACKSKKYSKRHLQDISNKPGSSNTKQRFKSKTPEPHKTYTPKPHAESKKVSIQKPVKKATTTVVLSKSVQKKTKISIEIPLSIKENSVVKKSINLIVMQTLKKQHIKKKQAEKSKNEEKERQNMMKKQLAELNHQTRFENFNRFKQEKFTPKYPWGIDERRITRQNDVKILKEAEEIRKKRREERERSKSAGKGRIGLDVLKLKKEHLKPQEEESVVKKPNREKNKSIVQYMKKQKKLRRKSKELQQERAREDENKRLLQLLELEKITRKPAKRHKSNKISRKRPIKKQEWIEESQIADSEDGEVMKILHGVRSKTPDSYEVNPHITSFDVKRSGRECVVFGVFPDVDLLENKGNGTQIVNDIVSKRHKNEESLPQACITMPLADIKATYSVIPTEEEYKESTSSDISKRKEEIRKKLSELRTRVDKAKNPKSEDLDDKRTRAAVKIQAWVRGFLTRLALHEYFNENTHSADYWDLENNEFEESSHNSYEDSEVKRIMKQKASSSSATNSRNEHRNMDRIAKKQQELEKILKSQSEWREVQKQKLAMLKNKDLEDMRMLAKKVGSEEMLMKYFVEIIERRYLNISQIFDENVEAVASALQQAIEDDNTESLLHTLERQENFASEMFQNLEKNEEMDELMKLKHNIDFNNIWSYSENEEQSVRISELDYAFNTRRSIQNSSNSSELILESVHFPKAPKSMEGVIQSSDPEQCLFADDLVIKVQDFVCNEAYTEAISEVWDVLLTCSAFINDVAERILGKVLSQESEFLGSFDMFMLKPSPIEKKQEHRGVGDIPLLELRPFRPIGIDMNEEYLLNYLSRLFDYLSPNAQNIENTLNTSHTFEPLDMLGMMQDAEIGVIIEKKPIIRVLPLNFYIELEKDSTEITPLQEAQLIHNKLIFDVVNETLFAKTRKSDPYPWSFDTRAISHKPVVLTNIITEVIEEVKQLNKIRAGKVPKIEFISNSDDSEEDIVQQLREEQLSCILAMEIIAQETTWINYEFEETQVKLDLADMTLEELVEETIKVLETL
ncbi:hypothetical protein SteCoe_9925 [Stentor coeruleus]|uniref:DUF4378 domain-containing protein n=1 Tax=Stentor coeruleus TaxID=5963 RepID=A0A1R2CGP1_9CILI|nr:hypothetical protein SteCoe_9925 [Stentor coeruleus]